MAHVSRTRRALLEAALALPALGWLTWADVTATARSGAPAGTAGLVPTPPCDDGDEPTPPQMEGPFFRRNSPERTSLLSARVEGTRLIVTGRVVTTVCEPIAGALLDFWHADDSGAYDVQGNHLRGHQFTDEDGRFTLETIVPGLYAGRTRHLHVKVQKAAGSILTTQLYFPGDARNRRDRLFREELLLDMKDEGPVRRATFDFVLRA